MTGSGGRPKPIRRDEAAKLLEAARSNVRTSQGRVASSIGRLLRAHDTLARGPTAGDAARFFLEILERPCDLDLLLFFHRHPRALLTADYLVSCVGYGMDEIHRSLNVLSRAGLVEWSKGTMNVEPPGIRLYRLTVGLWDDLLPAFLWVASSPEGRRALRQALADQH